MPTITAVTLRFSRKFQISRDDWIGADALVTVSIGEEEAESADPAEIRRIAIAEARQVVIETVAAEYLERTQLAARAAAGQLPAGQPEHTPDGEQPAEAPPATPEQSAPATNGRPKTTQEAETRFFARYGQIVGGENWKAVQTYLGSRAPKPTTIEGWFSAAEVVRDTHQMLTAQATDPVGVPLAGAQPLAGARPQDKIADVEPAPPSPAEHTSAHTVSHTQPRPRAAEPPIPTASRVRNAARRTLK